MKLRGVRMKREKLVYGLLRSVKTLSRFFYRFDISWIGESLDQSWENIRLVAFLNHTSLFEPVFVGWFPNGFLKRIASNGLMPVADKALQRPVMGNFFNLVAGNVVPISRMKDRTWLNLLNHVHSDSMVIIMPEGRMMRRGGLDKNGKPMTVRGGIADLIQKIPSGRILMAYSGGLHHIQAPGELIPRLFKTVQMRLETIDIQQYRERLLANSGCKGFRSAVIKDLELRRDRFCHTA
ncbi:MAG: 1-acyl-sn-glycerol-3-phosphate acyltransferase [Desulfobacterales bacterium]|nr:1-acyl-sn-glycerol-3-phosphate acyltransferase [Desulfobacterales bacterium]MDX2513026.1 1-acyl-sn-glycerol-3-phosphate acyltransferase [Desulfobacterales bacterium]